MPNLNSSFYKHVAQTSLSPDGFEASRGSGIYLFDEHNQPFIDCISGITVSSLGHGHPRIISAIKNQLDLHLHTQVYGEHIVYAQVKLAEKLSSLFPENLNNIYFVNSGAEAVEGAIKLAKKYTGRYEIVGCRNAYHGSTAIGDSLRSDFDNTANSRPLIPGITHISFNDFDDIEKITEHTAAVIIEPIQGEAGVILPRKGYLQKIKEQCDSTGALLIFDEIQTGMGRTGTLFAFQHEEVIPDILLLAKAFGGGLPLGAFISSKKIMEAISTNPPLGHMTTFGGNALCCAASIEALNIIQDEQLCENAIHQGDYIKEHLTHNAIKEIRGRGLMLAIELVKPEQLYDAIKYCKEEALLVDWFLFNSNAIRLAPPLIISGDEIKLLCEKFRKALDRL